MYGCSKKIHGQITSSKNIVAEDLYLVDTITIVNPVVIYFKETNLNNHSIRVGSILISKNEFDSLPNPTSTNFDQFISNSGYLFSTLGCELNHYLSQSNITSGIYFDLMSSIRRAEKDTVLIDSKEPKIYNGWYYDELYPQKYLLLLVSGKLFEECQSIDEIKVGNFNTYYKVLVPITKSMIIKK